MSIAIAKVLSPTAGEWDLTWSQCPYSTYFHSREWAEIWRAYTGGAMRADPRLIVFSDGTNALLPLSSKKNDKGFLRRYESSPGGTFGGWISTDHLTTTHAILLGEYLTKKIWNLTWRMNPYDPLVSKSGVTPTSSDVTHTLNLEEGFDRIYRGWTKGHRSAARKARKEGVVVKVASTIEEWQAYYQVYLDSLRRWGPTVTYRYAWPIFRTMFKRASPNIKLWLAMYQDAVVAGALTFYAGTHAVYWHGAALEACLHLRPVHLVLYDAVRDACEKGFTWFDFNPSGGHDGVRAFKESFGTQVLPCPLIYSERTISDYMNQIRGALRL